MREFRLSKKLPWRSCSARRWPSASPRWPLRFTAATVSPKIIRLKNTGGIRRSAKSTKARRTCSLGPSQNWCSASDRVGRTLLSDAFDFLPLVTGGPEVLGLSEGTGKTEVKSVGQECPTHTVI